MNLYDINFYVSCLSVKYVDNLSLISYNVVYNYLSDVSS